MIQEVGAIVYFLPLYSPDYNPIEEAFSKVKAEMRAMEKEAQVIVPSGSRTVQFIANLKYDL